MRFVSRVPFCKATVFIHARSLFGIPIALRDFALDNLAGVIATAKRLEASGTLHSDMIQAWRQESHSDVEARSMHNMPRPLTHFAIAYDSFHVMTGSTVDDFLRRRQRRQIRRTQRTHTQHSPFHQWLYEEMLRYDREHAFDYLHARLRDRGIEWTMVHDNLRRLPRAVPQAHRITLMRFLLNGLATTRRLRRALGIETRDCPFCMEAQADDIEHWCACVELRDCMRAIFSTQLAERVFNNETCHLQVAMQGTDLQHVCAILHAIWRCRCVIVSGYKFWSGTDLAYHMQSLIDDPWIVGAPHDLTSQERRATRMQIPPLCPGWAIYNSDGASRTSPDGTRLASSGALLTIDGALIARHGQHLGDMTNNEAEYIAVLHAIRHAERNIHRLVRFRVDSLLVCNQLSGRWACRAPHLQSLYEAGFNCSAHLRASAVCDEVVVEHVYREYNGDADGIANEVLDTYNPRLHPGGIVIAEGWL